MDEKSINDIPDADHQHLQSQEREQEFVEEETENRMADIDELDQLLKDLLTCTQELCQTRKDQFSQIDQDLLPPMQESLQKNKDDSPQTPANFLTPLQKGIQKSESNFSQIDQDFRLKDIPDLYHQHLQSQEREQELAEEEYDMYLADSVTFSLAVRDFRTRFLGRIPMRESNFSQIDQDFRTRRQEIFSKSEVTFSLAVRDFRTRFLGRIPMRENKTTKTTKSRPSTIKSFLLGSAFFPLRFCSATGEFIPVGSDLSLFETDLSTLANTCDHVEGNAIHCVLNDEGEFGIGCFSKIWVKQGYCPYFRNSFGVLDIRPCLGNSSICPTDRDQYLSNEVYKYPGCLIHNHTRVLDILTIQTTESTTIRSSDAGDEESMLLILVVILGLITLSLLLIHGLRFLRSMNITSRGLRSAYVPASGGHQDPHRHGLPDDDVDV